MSNDSAITVVNGHIQEILLHLPGIRTGDAESIHQARVATRRLREVLPLLSVSHPHAADELRRVARRVRRQLGRVRELDVIRSQMDSLEERLPLAAATIANARSDLREQQQRRRIKLIKALETLKVDRLRLLSGRGGRLMARVRPAATARTARKVLRTRIGEHAGRVATALDRSAGLQLPKRLHDVRIAVKKLRYSIEVAQQIALWQPPRLLDDLKKIQARLGDVHDEQVLLDAFDDLAEDASRRESAGDSARDTATVKAVVKGDLSRTYDRYLARVDRLRAICERCLRFASRPAPAERHAWGTGLTIVAAPVGLALLADRWAPQTPPASRRIDREVRPQIA